MKVEVIEEKQNPLLHRKELTVKVTGFDKTPSREEVRNQLIAKLGAKEKTLLLDEIKQEYGKQEATAFVKIYEDEEKLQKYELKHKIKRNGLDKKPEEKKEEQLEAAEEKKE